MTTPPHEHPIRVYYEDTDFSGVVYHANYLKYFERAREHLLDPDALVRLYRDEAIGFVVYRITDLVFREGAVFGDELIIRTVPTLQSDWRIQFEQSAWRAGGTAPLVRGIVELACVQTGRGLVPVPRVVVEALRARG